MSKFINKTLVCLFAILISLGIVTPNVFAVGKENNLIVNNTINTKDLYYEVDGERIDTLAIYEYEKINLNIEGAKYHATYQWQIMDNKVDGVWYDIYDAKEASISVTLALLGNLLREDNTSYLRCVITEGEEVYLSDALRVEVLKNDLTLMNNRNTENNIMTVADEETTPEFVTVKVEYPQYSYELQADGVTFDLMKQENDAFTAYVAVLQYGSEFVRMREDAIVPPKIIGYEARFIEKENADYINEKLEINIPSVTEDTTYTVEFIPSENTDYTVRYFFQNIYNDSYVEDMNYRPVVAKGTTGKHPDKNLTEKEFTGFTSLYFEPETIAADGSTVFHVYYERNYYLMEFDNDGGYGSDTIYVRYGSHVSVPNPVRSGYEFLGWDLVESDNPNDIINTVGDDIDVLPTTMPNYNTKYIALWEKGDTTYSVVYWAEDLGDTQLIGSKVVPSKAGETVSGTDDILTSDICGLVEHTHTDECYVCDNPDHTSHTHGDTIANYSSCYDYISTLGSAVSESNDLNVINEANTQITPEAGYLYLIYTEYDANDQRTWPKIALKDNNGNLKYYTINVSNNNVIPNSSLSTYVEGEKLVTAVYNGYSVDVYKAKKTCASSIHDVSCIRCEHQEHKHNGSCLSNYATDVVFLRADENVVVNGDGSTIVNVYYRYMRYTLRYYYAKSELSTDGSNPTYYVVGGSTYAFGTFDTYNDENTSVLTLLGRVDSGQWGQVKNIPQLKESVKDRYVTGSIKNGNTTYYYLEFSTYYGANIETFWPVDIFEPVEVVGDRYYNDGLAYFSAWNGEYRVKYTQDNSYRDNRGSANETIKGMRFYVDEDIVFDPQFKSEESYEDVNGNQTCLVSYLCFWDNGAKIDWSIPRKFNYKLYIKNGSEYEHYKTFVVYDNNKGEDNKHTVTYIDGYTCVKETVTTIHENQKGYMDEYDIVFKYDPAPYKLLFWNYNNYLTDGRGSDVQQGTTLEKHGEYVTNEDFILSKYPSALEPGAYEFEGWYTTKNFEEGTKITDWSSMVMPASDYMLYAHWVPKTRNVYFYEDYSKVGTTDYWYRDENGTTIPEQYPITVEHGTLIEEIYREEPETKDGYSFVGWFYMDEGNKKRYAPNSMQIKKDLHLFAEWKTSINATYEITYVLHEDTNIDGIVYPAGTEVASPLKGHVTAGKTKTFTAKIEDELLPLFKNANLFPIVNSHSLLVEPEEENKYEFEYEIDESVWYRVKYIDKITGLELEFPNDDEYKKAKTSTAAIVTEKFVPIEGYIPEDYYVRKVLAADGPSATEEDIERYNNEIIFYYIPDVVNGLYTIEYWTQNVGDESYTREQPEIGTWNISEPFNFTVTTNKYDGYEYYQTVVTSYVDGVKQETIISSPNTDITANVSKDGLEIKVYYNRNTYPYKIKYVEFGTGKVLYETPDTDEYTKKYKDTLSHTAMDSLEIDGTKYLFYETSEKPKTQSIEMSAYANELTYYYKAQEVEINYIAKCFVTGATNFGVVSLNYELVSSPSQIKGANATPGIGYKFMGWYIDEECTTQVDKSWLYNPQNPDTQSNTGTKLKPGSLTDEKSVTYYALFEPMYGKIKIKKEVVNDKGQSQSVNDIFLFKVKGQGKLEFIDFVVSIHGNNEITLTYLPIGKYTITELDNWSWKYNMLDVTNNGELNVIDETSIYDITFRNETKEVDWLQQETSINNYLK